MWVKRFIQQFGIGASIGTLLDAWHVRADVLSYPKSSWFFIQRTQQPIWAPVLFGCANTLFSFLSSLLFRHHRPKKSWWIFYVRLGMKMIGVLSAYWFTTLHRLFSSLDILYVLIVFYFANLSGHSFHNHSRLTIYCLICALCGVLVEYTLVSYHWFRHHQPVICGLPLWLPALYMNVALLIYDLDRLDL